MQLQRGRQLFLLIVAVVIFVLAAVYFFILQPQQAEVRLNRQTVGVLQQRQAAMQRFFEKHTDVNAFAKNLHNREAVIEKLLPEHLTINNYMLELQGKAATAGVMLKQIKPGKVKAEKNYFRQELNISFAADYFRLNDFLCMVEQNDRFAEIKEIKVQSTEKGPLLECNVLLLVFALKE